jgi:hypothetical protein
VKDKYKASAVFNRLYEALQPKLDVPVDIPSHIGYRIGKSRQTVRQYTCKPDSSGFRIPPLAVIDKMFQCVMHEDVHRAASLRGLTLSDGYRVNQVILSDYEAALDLADAIRFRVVPQGDAVVPALSDAARLRHQWRQVFFSGTVDRADLAIIAGVDVYDVGFVGREHKALGIQPLVEMVAKAMALEALSGRERSAA